MVHLYTLLRAAEESQNGVMAPCSFLDRCSFSRLVLLARALFSQAASSACDARFMLILLSTFAPEDICSWFRKVSTKHSHLL